MRMRLAAVIVAASLAGCGGSSPTAVVGGPPPAITVVSAETLPGLVRVVWRVADDHGLDFEVQRRNADRPWKFLAALAPDAGGTMALDDPGVVPGQPYTYRVRVLGGDPDAYGGVVEVVAAGGP